MSQKKVPRRPSAVTPSFDVEGRPGRARGTCATAARRSREPHTAPPARIHWREDTLRRPAAIYSDYRRVGGTGPLGDRADGLTRQEFADLLEFRTLLHRFLRWRGEGGKAARPTPGQQPPLGTPQSHPKKPPP